MTKVVGHSRLSDVRGGAPDAWQWYGITALGLVTFLAGAALFVFVWRRRPLLAGGVVLVGMASAALITGVFSSDWIEHLDRRSPGELLLMAVSIFAPILAVLLAVPEVVGRRER